MFSQNIVMICFHVWRPHGWRGAQTESSSLTDAPQEADLLPWEPQKREAASDISLYPPLTAQSWKLVDAELLNE